MSPVRLPDWEVRLSSYFATCKDKLFAWGEHDCALFAASAVHAMTGEDFGAPFRGRYSTPLGSVRALRRYGAGNLTDTFSATLGAPKHIAQVKRGDIVQFHTSEIDEAGTLGVCVGKFSYFVGSLDEFGQLLPSHDDSVEPLKGLIPIPTALCTQAWTVRFG